VENADRRGVNVQTPHTDVVHRTHDVIEYAFTDSKLTYRTEN